MVLTLSTSQFAWGQAACNGCTTILSQFGIVGVSGTAADQLYNPRGICFDGSNLYVANGVNRDIRKFPIGSANAVIFTGVDPIESPGGFINPWGVAVDGKGNLFVADIDGAQVMELNANTGAVEELASVIHPEDVTVDTLGNVFITNKTVVVEWPGGLTNAPVTIGTVNDAGGISSRGTTLFTADTANNAIEEWIPSGGVYDEYVVYAAPVTAGFLGVAVDPTGQYAAIPEGALNVVEFFNITSIPWTRVAVCVNPSVYQQPHGVAFDNSGDLYVSETNSFVAQEFSPIQCLSPTYYAGANPPTQGEAFIYPSPVREGNATFCYDLNQSGSLDLKIWNKNGELASEVRDHKPSGIQNTALNLTTFATGVYFYQATLTYDSGGSQTLKVGKFAVIH